MVNSWIDKKYIVIYNELFSRTMQSQYRQKVELDLSNYETKSDLKGATGINTSEFAKNVDLASLKFKVDEIIYINQKLFQVI